MRDDEFEELSMGLLDQLPVMQSSPREQPTDSSWQQACFPSADHESGAISKHDPADISGPPLVKLLICPRLAVI